MAHLSTVDKSWFQQWQNAIAFILCMVTAYLLYVQSFGGVWLMDDLPVLVNNPDIRSLSNFLENYYPGRPLRELTYLIDYSFFGLEPAGYYVQNIFWHGLCSWLIFLLCRQLNAPCAVSWFAAFLFLFHPIHVEVVANTSHRKDSLALVFCLLSVLSYLRGRVDGFIKGKSWILAALILWGIALLAKQNAIALPLVIIFYELSRLPEKYQAKGVLLVSAGALSVALGRIVYLYNSESFLQKIRQVFLGIGHFSEASAEKYFATVLNAWVFMGSKLLCPVDLSMEYAVTVPEKLTDPWVVVGFLVLIAIVFALYRSRKMSLLISFSLSWLFLFFIPTSNLFDYMSYFVADRYWYAPSVGAVLLFAYGVWLLMCRNNKFYIVFAFVVLALLGGQTWAQQKYWQNEEVFYSHMLEINPWALEGLVGLGYTHMGRGDYEKAVEYLEKASQRSQNERIPLNLGYISFVQGDYEKALGYTQRALKIEPRQEEAYSNLGSIYDALGQPQAAIENLKKALEINQHYEKAYLNLGMVYENIGNLKEARDMYRKSLQALPEYGLAHFNLGNTFYYEGRKEEALKSYSEAMKFSPDNADAIFNYIVVARELGQNEVVPAALARLKVLDARRAEMLERDISSGG